MKSSTCTCMEKKGKRRKRNSSPCTLCSASHLTGFLLTRYYFWNGTFSELVFAGICSAFRAETWWARTDEGLNLHNQMKPLHSLFGGMLVGWLGQQVKRLPLPVSGLYSSPLVCKSSQEEKSSTVRRVWPLKPPEPLALTPESEQHQLHLPAMSGISPRE